MAEIVLDGVGKVYADGTRAVTDLSLDIADGEFLVLVGPSGCGKSTALRMIAGLESISEGTVAIGGRVVNQVPARDRDVAMVFQSYALYPHLNVRENIGFGLKLRKVPKAEIRERVDKAAAILGLTEQLDRKPRNLSGGQRQRVAMGRAIVREPQAFLMDEPLSNLDAKLRVQMRAEIGYLQDDLGVTTIYVTHDQTEAMTLGDRVAVMNRGVLQQVAPPQELYDRPVNLFVASFIGSPAMNLLSAQLAERDGSLRVNLGEDHLDVPATVLQDRPALRGYLDREVIVGIRPEDLEDAVFVGRDVTGRTIKATASLVEPMGSDIMAHLSVAAHAVGSDIHEQIASEAGSRRADADRATVVGRFSPRSAVALDQPITVYADTDRLHFFDPDSGQAIWN